MSRVFVWGANSHGQLGLGMESEMCVRPVELPGELQPDDLRLADVDELRGGGGHLLALCNGTVFACGWNHRGQLGLGSGFVASETSPDCSNRFGRIERSSFGHQPVVAVRAGWDCSAALLADGSAFVWGSNAHGQLAVDKKSLQSIDIPRKLHIPTPDKAPIIDIQFGLRSAVIALKDALYVFAADRMHAHLAQTCPSEHRHELVKHAQSALTFSVIHVSVAHVACGVRHFAYVDRSQPDVVHVCGDSKHNLITVRTAGARIVQLRSGWTHLAALTDDGRVRLWGRNNYGQLGSRSADESNNVVLWANDSIVGQLHLGAEHGLIVEKSGQIRTWGWNEHGNCGNGSETDVYEPIDVRLPGPVRLAGTGCGFCVAIVK